MRALSREELLTERARLEQLVLGIKNPAFNGFIDQMEEDLQKVERFLEGDNGLVERVASILGMPIPLDRDGGIDLLLSSRSVLRFFRRRIQQLKDSEHRLKKVNQELADLERNK